ncbi:Glycosyltransferase involved in cell wall bisynthesis [Filimonas lacunae]|uniref:Glycosyltransferase involved in cell wall bisynthesis n=1 Tax=Filimonas lacunae TaxID=477680 RepID=A0A173MRC6_9BACT|nr:glycosyltransferase family A protein [Filimonas lacunae]BAV10202.1 glycosyl transferase [Filimonas lacunae]SIT18314.1 Glycosyltransferase involved in cell wall bisynthesis [Filimonas lacunae]
MGEPLVSVIIPCYNQGRYIDETVKSVLEQTFTNFQIIVVDDGSTDLYTQQILKGKSWPKTTIVHIPNGGVANARNTAIRMATGKYILPLDGDDKIAPSYLEKAVRVLEEDDTVMVVTTLVHFFGRRNRPYHLPEYSLEHLMGQNLLVCTSMFRKLDFERTGGFDSNMREGLEDWDFWLKMLKEGGRVHRINEVLFYYRLRRQSRNNAMSIDQQQRLRYQIYNNHRELFAEHFFNPMYSFEYVNLAYSKEYRLGKLLLTPVRRLLDLFKL